MQSAETRRSLLHVASAISRDFRLHALTHAQLRPRWDPSDGWSARPAGDFNSAFQIARQMAIASCQFSSMSYHKIDESGVTRTQTGTGNELSKRRHSSPQHPSCASPLATQLGSKDAHSLRIRALGADCSPGVHRLSSQRSTLRA